MSNMKIPQKITDLCDALNAVGFKSTIGTVHWPDGDVGHSILAGSYKDKLLNSNLEVVGETVAPVFSMSFRSNGKLQDYEGVSIVQFFNEANV